MSTNLDSPESVFIMGVSYRYRFDIIQSDHINCIIHLYVNKSLRKYQSVVVKLHLQNKL